MPQRDNLQEEKRRTANALVKKWPTATLMQEVESWARPEGHWERLSRATLLYQVSRRLNLVTGQRCVVPPGGQSPLSWGTTGGNCVVRTRGGRELPTPACKVQVPKSTSTRTTQIREAPARWGAPCQPCSPQPQHGPTPASQALPLPAAPPSCVSPKDNSTLTLCPLPSRPGPASSSGDLEPVSAAMEPRPQPAHVFI